MNAVLARCFGMYGFQSVMIRAVPHSGGRRDKMDATKTLAHQTAGVQALTQMLLFAEAHAADAAVVVLHA